MASTELRTAAQQALEAMRRAVPTGEITLADWMKANRDLEAALVEEALQRFTDVNQELEAALAETQTWVCPDSAEHRYGKPGHCEDCGKTLVQVAEPVQEGCDHCNSPLYAAVKCRVCGRVTSAKPVQEQPVCDECGKHKRDGWALYCVKCVEPMFARPQRKPLTLTDEVIAELWHKNGGFHHHFARAIERWLNGNL